ncbi:MAG: hypothetical protein ACOYL6_01165 [Bacteriovoracaceae bacterium]
MTTPKVTEEVKVDPAIGPRNFRHNPDIENFYRFVHDNSLRHEAKVLFKTILDKVKKSAKKKEKESKKAAKH